MISKHINPRDFQLSANISIKNKYFFMCSSKCASGTLKTYFQSKEFEGSGFKIQNVDNKYMSPLLSPFQCSGELFEEALFSESYYKFTFVRNPFHRALACYLFKIKNINPMSPAGREFRKKSGLEGDVSFNSFLSFLNNESAYEMNKHYRPLYFDQCHDVIKYNHVGKVETLRDDLLIVAKNIFGNDYMVSGLFDAFGQPLISDALDPLNPVESIPKKLPQLLSAREFYDDESIELVCNIYKKDFSEFGYSLALP